MNLIGDNASPERERAHSPHHNVPANAPPVFLLHAEDDASVVVENSRCSAPLCWQRRFRWRPTSLQTAAVWSYLPGHVAPRGRDRGQEVDDLGAAARHRDDGPPLPRRIPRHPSRILLRRCGEGGRGADRGPAPLGRLELLYRFAGPSSTKHWYETFGKNAWRMEEFQHYADNSTIDDMGTSESAQFLLRVYLEKRDPKYKPALERAVNFVL
jgi:hypothetical protein